MSDSLKQAATSAPAADGDDASSSDATSHGVRVQVRGAVGRGASSRSLTRRLQILEQNSLLHKRHIQQAMRLAFRNAKT